MQIYCIYLHSLEGMETCSAMQSDPAGLIDCGKGLLPDDLPLLQGINKPAEGWGRGGFGVGACM